MRPLANVLWSLGIPIGAACLSIGLFLFPWLHADTSASWREFYRVHGYLFIQNIGITEFAVLAFLGLAALVLFMLPLEPREQIDDDARRDLLALGYSEEQAEDLLGMDLDNDLLIPLSETGSETEHDDTENGVASGDSMSTEETQSTAQNTGEHFTEDSSDHSAGNSAEHSEHSAEHQAAQAAHRL